MADRPISEKEFQETVIDLMHTLGYRVAHFRPAMNARGDWRTPVAADGKGFPDLVAIRPDKFGRYNGRVVFVELKSDKGKLSKEQAEWIADLGSAGAETYVWRPSDWNELVKILR